MKFFARGLVLATAVAGIAGWGSAAMADDNTPAQNPTFYKDVSPILQQKCQSCHRPAGANLGGMVAPMSLITYDEVRPWVKSMVKEVQARNMPPWDASPEFHGVFVNERAMTDAQVETIVKWGNSGAPAGDAKDAPAPKKFFEGQFEMGTPDLVLKMPEKYLVADDVDDQYIDFITNITEEMLPEPRWIQALEFRGGSKVVHHIIGYLLDNGRVGQVAGGAERADRGMIGGVAPGNDPDYYPEGYGLMVSPGQRLQWQMHYNKAKGPGTAVEDQSMLALKFYPKGANVKHIHIDNVGKMDFEIPPNHPDWKVGMARTLDRPIRIFTMTPHMHLRGSKAVYTAYYPDGKIEKLLDVPFYDFSWQTSYEYKAPKVLPAGTRLEVQMAFNNSTTNKANPDPNQAIRFGGPTTDEMALGWLTWTYADEDAPTKTAAGGQ